MRVTFTPPNVAGILISPFGAGETAQDAASAPIINFVFMFCLPVTLFVSCERLLRSQALYARRRQISRGENQIFLRSRENGTIASKYPSAATVGEMCPL